MKTLNISSATIINNEYPDYKKLEVYVYDDTETEHQQISLHRFNIGMNSDTVSIGTFVVDRSIISEYKFDGDTMTAEDMFNNLIDTLNSN